MLRVKESRMQKPKRKMSACKKVQRKYRRAYQRKLQQREYARLAAVLPTLTKKAEVDEVDVVESAIEYIDYLHAQILQRMATGILPADFKIMMPLPE